MNLKIPKVNRRWFHFGVGTLLLLTGLICVVLSAYRRGYDDGREERASKMISTRTYNVADLVARDPTVPGGFDFKTVMQRIQKEVYPDSWVDTGGTGAIEEFPTNLSLVVSQTQEAHQRIAKSLAKMRAEKQSR